MSSKSSCFRIVLVVTAGVLAAGLGVSCAAAAAAGHRPAHAAKAHHHKLRHHPGRRTPLVATVAPAPAAVAPGAAAAGLAPVSCPDGDLVPTAANIGAVRAAALCLVNQQRIAAGLAPLRENADLVTAATRHSEDMVTRDYFDHVGPTGVGVLDRVLAAGYAAVGAALSVGENIAAATGPLATPTATVASWMQSPGHRENILNPGFVDTGIGVAADAPALLGAGQGGATYTECFGAAD